MVFPEPFAYRFPGVRAIPKMAMAAIASSGRPLKFRRR
jgi:hypothetical protein